MRCLVSHIFGNKLPPPHWRKPRVPAYCQTHGLKWVPGPFRCLSMVHTIYFNHLAPLISRLRSVYWIRFRGSCRNWFVQHINQVLYMHEQWTVSNYTLRRWHLVWLEYCLNGDGVLRKRSRIWSHPETSLPNGTLNFSTTLSVLNSISRVRWSRRQNCSGFHRLMNQRHRNQLSLANSL